MRFVWGTIVGAAVGWAGGPFGSLFGAGLGMLVDQVIEGMRRRKALHSFLCDPAGPPPRRVAPVAAATIGLLAATAQHRPHPNAASVEAVVSWINRESNAGSVWTLHGLLRDAATADDPPDLAGLAAVVERHRSVDACGQLFDLLLTVARDGHGTPVALSERMREELDTIGEGLGVPTVRRTELLHPSLLLDATACDVLGVPRDASAEQVKRVYRRLAAQFHPDTLGELDEGRRRMSSDAFIRITEAYERLIDDLALRGRL